MPKAGCTLPNDPLLVEVYDGMHAAYHNLMTGLLIADTLAGELENLPRAGDPAITSGMVPDLTAQLGWVLEHLRTDCAGLAQAKLKLRQLMTALAAVPA